MKFQKKSIILSIPILIAVIAIAFFAFKAAEPDENIITGIVESTEVDVASKIPGRIDTIFVDEGSFVKKGDILATLESKEMDAKVEQARGAMDAAKAKMTMVQNGARKEEKEATEKLYNQAKYQYDYASKTWNRFQSLYKDGVVSTQEKDEVEFKYNAAKEQMEAAKAKYDMVMKGARYEEIDAVQSLYHQAENAFNEATAYSKELSIKAPVDGEISKKVSDAGEIINSGYPVFTIMQPKDSYVVLQIREDKMKEIKMGKTFKGKIPALDNAEVEFEVSYIASMGDFATWKPTNQKGEFDLKTFEVHLKSRQPIDGMRPGMTVNISM
jgi:HlyD family secretion protein